MTVDDYGPREATLHLKDIKGNPIPDENAVLTIVGTDSDQYYTAFKEAVSIRDPAVETDTISEYEDMTKVLAACIVGWNQEYFKEPYSIEAAARMMSLRKNKWIRDNVEGFVLVRTNFFPDPI